MRLQKTFESFTATGKYTTIEELDKDCIIVVRKNSTGHGTKAPERFWGYEVIMAVDFDNVSEHYFRSTYKPSTLPYYTDEQIINAMNENIERGHYILVKNGAKLVGFDVSMPK